MNPQFLKKYSKTVNNVKEKDINNPFIAAKREWIEFYGDIVNLNKKLIIGITISIFITLIAVIGLVYTNNQSRFIPYIIEIDKLGAPIYAGMPTKTSIADPKIIKYTLAEFINNIRSVYADPIVQERFLTKAYNYLEPNSQAHTEITALLRNDNPIKRTQTDRVLVNILNVSPISDNTWQVDWHERVTDIKGQLKKNTYYRGILTITISSPIEDKDIFNNPAGIWISNFNYSTLSR
ncbi:MAG: hypothetical protein LBD61_02540 [Endomicrobium sp.]|jgi:type IV secretion system protein VirB5|nr:hypothetical protein [Endomicrobium sp.]